MADAHIIVKFDEKLAQALATIEAERNQLLADLASAYRERAHLVALLGAVLPAVLREDEQNEDEEWAIIYVQLPTGQASWHIHPRDLDLFPHVKYEPSVEWDGHTTDEKYQRIRDYTAERAARPAPKPRDHVDSIDDGPFDYGDDPVEPS